MADGKRAKAKAKPAKPKAKPKKAPAKPKARARRQAPVNRNTNSVRVNVVNRVGGGGAAAPAYTGPDRGYFAFNPVFDAGGAKQPALPPMNTGIPTGAGPVSRTGAAEVADATPAGVALRTGGWDPVGFAVDHRWVPSGMASAPPATPQMGPSRHSLDATRPANSGPSISAGSVSRLPRTETYEPSPPDLFQQALKTALPSSSRRTPTPPPTARPDHYRFPTGIRQPHRKIRDPGSMSRSGSSTVPGQLAF